MMNERRKHMAIETLVAAVLISVLLGATGGIMIFNNAPPWERGVGVLLIVLVPMLLEQLVKDRPPSDGKGNRR